MACVGQGSVLQVTEGPAHPAEVKTKCVGSSEWWVQGQGEGGWEEGRLLSRQKGGGEGGGEDTEGKTTKERENEEEENRS